ncbi:type IV secretory system conjugative DNA transfer family protein [Klebsiella pneumoniae]|uniref:type IV secretory system conjugative DNA transfer family protein n=1 Tax=Klebsiella pneumoniae TaxID=573 RepID=UPI001D182B14|nr:type IV secretory system conjugative DNA transfer family protein [Klebsiella pneumoniae]
MLKAWITTWTRQAKVTMRPIVTGSMLNDAAHTIGFRGGKAERAKEIRAALEISAATLDTCIRFQPLISSEGYLPPVIAEAKRRCTHYQ